MAISLEQLSKFCAPKGFHPTASWQEEPFQIESWQIATNGRVLVAVYAPQASVKLATLEKCSNRDLILEWLSVEIPEQNYSTEHLKEFLVHKTVSETEYGSDPMVFNGCRIDGNYLRNVFALINEPYRFSIGRFSSGGMFHFRFSKIIAIIMGMIQISDLDTRYEPKAIAEAVL